MFLTSENANGQATGGPCTELLWVPIATVLQYAVAWLNLTWQTMKQVCPSRMRRPSTSEPSTFPAVDQVRKVTNDFFHGQF